MDNLTNMPLIDIINQMDLLQKMANKLPELYDKFNEYYEELRQELINRFPPLSESEDLKLSRNKN